MNLDIKNLLDKLFVAVDSVEQGIAKTGKAQSVKNLIVADVFGFINMISKSEAEERCGYFNNAYLGGKYNILHAANVDNGEIPNTLRVLRNYDKTSLKSSSIKLSDLYVLLMTEIGRHYMFSKYDRKEHLLRRSYSIGSMVIFPVHKNSMNQRRGTNLRIADRWDLTLECIRRHYAGEKSPLSKVIEGDKAFYDLFVDFKGYVDFFFMQDCVSEDYSSVDIWMGDASFEKNGLPETVEDYFKFLVREHIFLDKRNARIQEYCMKHQAVGKQNSD